MTDLGTILFERTCSSTASSTGRSDAHAVAQVACRKGNSPSQQTVKIRSEWSTCPAA